MHTYIVITTHHDSFSGILDTVLRYDATWFVYSPVVGHMSNSKLDNQPKNRYICVSILCNDILYSAGSSSLQP